ncbi:hypothetical protein PspLS_03385 [Pyricularia sp. CBS 133598]|nr:hypothetical protein PspLS_03385 [Pyricularia sp. CBS 133598]
MPRPSTPGRMVKSPGPTRPTSPPQTPKSASASKQQKNRKGNCGGRSRQSKHQQAIREQLPHFHFGAQFMNDMDGGPVYGFRPSPRGADRLSPRSALSLSEDETEDEVEVEVEVKGNEEEEEDDDEDDDGEADVESSASDSQPPSCSPGLFTKSSAEPTQKAFHNDSYAANSKGSVPCVVTAQVTVETLEIREYDDSDDDDCVVIHPDVIEDADSESSRSRSRSRSRQRRDSNMASEMRDLNVFASSDEDDLEETEYERKMREHREERRRARMNSGSITKRTISERGSDSDSEDLANGHGLPSPHDPTDAAHRRLRRRLARNSVLFHKPAAPKIDEADEPDSSDEERDVLLARELSFFNYIFMEVDSP